MVANRKLYQTDKVRVVPFTVLSEIEIQLFTGISAGFPSPAADFTGASIDLTKFLIDHPNTTFFVEVQGDSLTGRGIMPGDYLIIDKILKPSNGDIAICYIDGDFTAKILRIEGQNIWLDAANDKYKSRLITPENEFSVWGIYTGMFRKNRRGHVRTGGL